MSSRAALDAFEQLKQIGKGSYGEVTLARHRKDRKQVSFIAWTNKKWIKKVKQK